jgi:hypothetical protein
VSTTSRIDAQMATMRAPRPSRADRLLRRRSCSLSFCRNSTRCWAAGAMSRPVATAAATSEMK